METETELDLDRIENQKERKILKPTIKAFAEKGLTRKIDGKYLEGDHQDRLVFGLNFEIPLIEEGARNIQELYAKKTREKILELKAQYEQTAMSKEHELNGIKKSNLNREIQRKEEKLKMYESLLKLSWNDVVRGQKEINDYSEDLDEYLNEKLELIDHKVEQVKELF
jgi:outer membrane protein TolC